MPSRVVLVPLTTITRPGDDDARASSCREYKSGLDDGEYRETRRSLQYRPRDDLSEKLSSALQPWEKNKSRKAYLVEVHILAAGESPHWGRSALPKCVSEGEIELAHLSLLPFSIHPVVGLVGKSSESAVIPLLLSP